MEVSPRIIAIYGVVVMHDWSNSVKYCVYVVVMLGLYLVSLFILLPLCGVGTY